MSYSSSSSRKWIELGDIIEIISPERTDLHEEIFFVSYIDKSVLELINIKSITKILIPLHKSGIHFEEDANIEKVKVLSRNASKGYARQNGLHKNVWVDIFFGGDVPKSITAEITNLEEDMIELTTYPENKILYIDFAYQGVPKNIPLKKICIRQKPESFHRYEQTQKPEDYDYEQDLQENEEVEIPDETYHDRLQKMYKIHIIYSKNMFANYIKWNNAVLKDSILKLNDPVYPDTHYLGNMNSYDVNANYSQVDNSIFIPYGILQPPFLTNNFIHTMAFLGIIFCHELIHALDDEGSKYDANGVYKDWWKKTDREKYKQLSKQVLNLYKHYSKNDNKTEDLKLGENIADLSSMALVEDILDYFVEDKEACFKQFYSHYAKLYRTQHYKSYFEIVKNDYHSYEKYRINCILANSKYFRKYYNISPDDKMYHKIIDIW